METLPSHVMGFASGCINTGGQIGGFLAPMAIGFLIEATGSYESGFALMAGGLIVAGLLVLTLKDRKRTAIAK
jgi:nitrate/nitrite transporter NarK